MLPTGGHAMNKDVRTSSWLFAASRALLTCLTAGTLVMFGAASANARGGPPDWHYTFQYDGEQQNLCGMTVRLDGFLHGTFHEKSSGFNEHWKIRLTNVKTGLWVLSELNGIAKDLKVVDDGSGIITV